MSTYSRTRSIIRLLLWLALAAVPAQAQQWLEASSGNLRVLTDQGSAEIERTFHQASFTRTAMAGSLLKVDLPIETVLIVSRDPQVLGKVFPAGWLGKVDAITVKSADFVLVAVDARSSRARRSLAHELVHAILYSHYGQIPWWLDEGLAEHFAVAEESAGAMVFGKLDAKGRMNNGCRITRDLTALPVEAPRGVPDQEWKSLVGSSAILVRYLLQHVQPAALLQKSGSWAEIAKLAGKTLPEIRTSAEKSCGEPPVTRIQGVLGAEPLTAAQPDGHRADEALARAQVRLPERAREGIAYFRAHQDSPFAELQLAIGLQIAGALDEATQHMQHACETLKSERCKELE